MRVLVFGDSIAFGFWDSEGGWVARLRKHYDKRQIEDLKHRDEPTILNLGVSGGTSKTILARLENEIKARTWRGEEISVVISTGLNDSYRILGKNGYNSSPEEYGKSLQKLVDTAKKYTEKIMLVGLVAVDETKTTPVFWRDISYINKRIKTFEDTMRSIANENDLVFVPVHETFKKRLHSGEKLLADGVHPNNGGHQLIFQLVRPELDRLINT